MTLCGLLCRHIHLQSGEIVLKMGAAFSSKMLLPICQSTWRQIPTDENLHQHFCENLWSCIQFYLNCLMKFRAWQYSVYLSFALNWPLTMCNSEGSVSHATSSPGRTMCGTAIKKMMNGNKLWIHHAASPAILQDTNDWWVKHSLLHVDCMFKYMQRMRCVTVVLRAQQSSVSFRFLWPCIVH